MFFCFDVVIVLFFASEAGRGSLYPQDKACSFALQAASDREGCRDSVYVRSAANEGAGEEIASHRAMVTLLTVYRAPFMDGRGSFIKFLSAGMIEAVIWGCQGGIKKTI